MGDRYTGQISTLHAQPSILQQSRHGHYCQPPYREAAISSALFTSAGNCDLQERETRESIELDAEHLREAAPSIVISGCTR